MLKGILIFVGGATLGALVSWKLLEKKYADIADKEITSFKEHTHKDLDDCLEEVKEEILTGMDDMKYENHITSTRSSMKSYNTKNRTGESHRLYDGSHQFCSLCCNSS